MPFPTRASYEELIYGVSESAPGRIISSTLRLYSVSAMTATVSGEIHFANGLVLRVREFLDFKKEQIVDYSYTIYRGEQKIRWYDPQPHPGNPVLQSTFPHHYHTDPDIKHNRQPAEGISFTAPNLPVLIAICCQME